MRLGKKKEDTAVGIDMKDWSSIIVRRLCYSKTAMTSIRNPKVTSRERLDTPQAVPNSSDPTPTEKKNFDDANDRRLDISTAQENVKISNFNFPQFCSCCIVNFRLQQENQGHILRHSPTFTEADVTTTIWQQPDVKIQQSHNNFDPLKQFLKSTLLWQADKADNTKDEARK